MNKRKITSLLLTGAMVMSVVAPISVHAAAQPANQIIPVTYTAGTIIPDPDNPTNPKWGVALPTAVSFNDSIKESDVSVSLQRLGGATGYETGLTVIVQVKSDNGYSVNDGSGDKVSYDLKYGSVTANTGVDAISIATLNEGAETQAGTAILKGNATSTKEHLDKLTYTIQKQ